MLKKITETILIIDLILGLLIIPMAKLDIPILIFIFKLHWVSGSDAVIRCHKP